MGNDASRPLGEGLTPPRGGPSGGVTPNILPSPRTPTGVRRAKSFTSANNTAPPQPTETDLRVDRSIQRMDKTIRKRVRGGITYNMKIIIRGERGTGKTSLFHRLKGDPIPETHAPTPQLQSATINWNFRTNSEESVKCDVWDVVDKGFHPHANGNGAALNGNNTSATGDGDIMMNPFGPGAMPPTGSGSHLVATVDATTVDVYHETHGVVFLLDVTKPHTLEYVRQHLDQVPVHIPTLVLGNFRDCGNQRKIFKEDIQELLYGGGTSHQKTLRRPMELLYFECSLLNCYGLKALHQYFGIPFLQLKQQTIRQQLRILEGEFAHLKHDLQAKIAENRYADYLDHIKATGSDIRTGRRVLSRGESSVVVVSSTTNTSATSTPATSPEASMRTEEADSPVEKARLDRTLSSSSDIVVATEPPPQRSSSSSELQVNETSSRVEMEDLPEREVAMARGGSSLKIDYTAEERLATAKPAMKLSTQPVDHPVSAVKEETPAVSVPVKPTPARKTAKPRSEPVVGSPEVPTTAVNLEDFQVPKPRFSDLDNFYSDSESDDDDCDDGDVVVGPVGGRGGANSHKQKFVDSDESEDEDEQRGRVGSRHVMAPPRGQGKRSSPRRPAKGKPAVEEPATGPTVVEEKEEKQMEESETAMPPLPMPALPMRPLVSPSAARTASPQRSPHRRVKGAIAAAVQVEAVAVREEIEAQVTVDVEEQEAVASVDVSVTETTVAKTTVETTTVDSVESIEVNDEMETATETEIVTVEAPEPVSVESDEEEQVAKTEAVMIEEKPEPVVITTVVPEIIDKPETADPLEEEKDDLVVSIGDNRMDTFFSEDDSDTEARRESVDATATSSAPLSATTEKKAISVTSVPQLHVDDDSDSDGEERTSSQASAGVVALVKSQSLAKTTRRQELVLTDEDDSDADAKTKQAPVGKKQPTGAKSARSGRRVEMLTSDDESDDEPTPTPVAAAPRAAPVSVQSPPFAPIVSTGNALEDFLNASDSDSDAGARRTTTASKKKAQLAASDSEDESDNDRFAAYDAKKTSRTKRKKQREEIRAVLGSSSSKASSLVAETTTESSSSRRTASLVNQDVLAAIRQAEQDALRMLESSAPPPPLAAKASPYQQSNADDEDEDLSSSSRRKKTKSSSSSRRKGARGDGDDEAKEKKKKKRDKDTSGGSSSRSKRREMIPTDEDEP